MNRLELTNKHAENPEPGDYWHEMFNPVAVVLEVKGDELTICKTTRRHGEGWTWDLEFCYTTTKQKFKDWISYDNIEGYWCDVSDHKHAFAVELYNEHKGEDIS